jgi:DNA-binding PadR family transcriptional regulator
VRRSRRPSPQTEAILRALAERGESWSHGYELCTRLRLAPSTVYPALMRLAERDQVETDWEAEPPRGRPPRHLYRLTAAGAALLAGIEPATSRAPARPSPAVGLAIDGAGA